MKTKPTALQLLQAAIVQCEERNCGKPVRVQTGENTFMNSTIIKNFVADPLYITIYRTDFLKERWVQHCMDLGIDPKKEYIKVILK